MILKSSQNESKVSKSTESSQSKKLLKIPIFKEVKNVLDLGGCIEAFWVGQRHKKMYQKRFFYFFIILIVTFRLYIFYYCLFET